MVTPTAGSSSPNAAEKEGGESDHVGNLEQNDYGSNHRGHYGQDQYQKAPQYYYSSAPPPQPPRPRPALADAASPYLSSFGVRLTVQHHRHHQWAAQSPRPRPPPPSVPKNERSCLGHRETIFGLSFSPSGRYLATASQDSTIRLWDVPKNRLIDTLKGHNVEHECLRVDWAPDARFWRRRRRRRRGDGASEEEEQEQAVEGFALLASSGADGVVKVWRHLANKNGGGGWECAATIDHDRLRRELIRQSGTSAGEDSALHNNGAHGELDQDKEEDAANKNGKDENGDPPQVYALQFISGWGEAHNSSSSQEYNSDGGTEHASGVDVLLTSSDDFLHLWCQHHPEHVGGEENSDRDISNEEGSLTLKRYTTIRFSHLGEGHGGVFVHAGLGYGDESAWCHDQLAPGKSDEGNSAASRIFGGAHRNPDNLVFVFDACYCPARSLLGVALSDGTLRLINTEGVCVSVLELREWKTHITSLAWDDQGWRLVFTAASGYVILWEVGNKVGEEALQTRCRAVMEGGHDPGRPIFGALFCGSRSYCQELLLSWGVDGKICMWDAWSEGHLHNPVAVLLDKGPEFPIYSVGVHEIKPQNRAERIMEEGKTIVSVGGGREGGFLGIPVFLYDVINAREANMHSSG